MKTNEVNTYSKYCPNVFLAKCPAKHESGEHIIVTTKYGKENESIVFNLVFERDGFYYYSIIRADGFNVQEWAKRRAERLERAAGNAESKSNEYYKRSNKDRDFLSLGEPIKIGHHSERRHRKVIQQANDNMRKSVEFSDKAESYEQRAEYWKERENTINLSMPESLDFFEFELERAKAKHEGLKNGTIERRHSFSLTYAKKEVNEIEKKLQIAVKLWAPVEVVKEVEKIQVRTLADIKKEKESRVSALLDSCGVFFAFSNEQFEQNKTPLEEGEKYVSIGAGGYMPKSKVNLYLEGMKDINKWYKKEVAYNKLRKENIADALRNHEAGYTGEIEPALNELGEGYSKDEVKEVLKSIVNE